MPRGPRLAFQNSFYHVFNRGINKQPIFIDETDYKFFLLLLLRLKNKYDHSIFAYCLMPNHFHLSIQTRKTPISKILSSLATSYAMHFNKKYSHLGPVFQNRFKSILIENDSYFLQLNQYITLNPVKANLCQDPAQYPFSSFRETIGLQPPNLLDQDITRIIGETPQSLKQYTQFIYGGLQKDLSGIEKLFEKEETTFGSAHFSTVTIRKYLREANKNKNKKVSKLGGSNDPF